MGYRLLFEYAKEQAKMGPDWEVYRTQWMPPDAEPHSPNQFMYLTGAIAPILKSGPRKGRRNWKRMDKSTVRSLVIWPKDFDAFEAEHERRTGICSACDGRARRLGNSCRRCKGSGKVGDPVP